MMKKNIILTISLLFMSFIVSAQEIKQMTYFMSETINGLISSGNFDVQLSQGDKTGVTIDIDSTLLEKLSVSKTEEGFVRVDLSDFNKLFSKKATPLVKIVVSKLDYLSVANSSVIAKGDFTCDKEFKSLLTGVAYVAYIKMNCDKATVDIKGKAQIDMCKINAKESCEIISSESASSNLEVKAAALVMNVSTMSKVELAGEATTNAKIESSGTSMVEMLKFTTPNMRASALGVSKIKANVTGEADVTVGGTASFRYIGNGKVTGSTKGVKPL